MNTFAKRVLASPIFDVELNRTLSVIFNATPRSVGGKTEYNTRIGKIIVDFDGSNTYVVTFPRNLGLRPIKANDRKLFEEIEASLDQLASDMEEEGDKSLKFVEGMLNRLDDYI